MIKNIMGHGLVCYIPKFMEIEPLVPRDKVFKAFQNIWASDFHFLVPVSFHTKIGSDRHSSF